MNKLLYSGPAARTPEYQSLLHINHTKSCPTYWHHIHLLTSPFFYHLHLETPQRPFHIFTRLTPNIKYYVCLLWNPRPNSSNHEVSLSSFSGGNPRGSAPMSDVIHHPTRYHGNTSTHDIPTSNIMTRRKSIIPSGIMIQNPYLLH